METTRLSRKGQIVLPKRIGASRGWAPGTEFTIEETQDRILLRPSSRFPLTSLDEVAGCRRSKSKAKTIAPVEEALVREVRRRRDRGRY